MKKIYAIILFVVATLGANAQCTPDNSLTQPGYYPSELDTAQIAVQYGQVLQFRIISDTTVIVFGQSVKADIDSIKLVNVLGLPNGFTYACNNANCNFTPNQTYCAKLSGTAAASQNGDYPIRLAVVAYAHGTVFGTPTTFPPQPDTIDQFTLTVGTGGGTTGITEAEQAYGVNVYPNPASGEATVWANADETLVYTLSDITGKIYRSETMLNTNGLQTAVINLNGLAKGIYLVQVSGEKGLTAKKLVVE